MTRRDIRAQVLAVLYAAEATASPPELDDLGPRATRYATGVIDHRDELDSIIEAASTHWRIDRMPAVDRNVLRIAVWELAHTDVPVGVVISEAVELAKQYSTGRSGAFVNGVLGKIATEVRGGGGGAGESTRLAPR